MPRKPRSARSVASFEQVFSLALQACFAVAEKDHPFVLSFDSYSDLMNVLARWGVFLKAAEAEFTKTKLPHWTTEYARACKWVPIQPDGTPLVGRLPSVASAAPGPWKLSLVSRNNNDKATKLMIEASEQLRAMPKPNQSDLTKTPSEQDYEAAAAIVRGTAAEDALNIIGVRK